MSDEDVQRFMRAGHDFYVLPEEALRLGIADQVIGNDEK
jgi:ATP-dependent protease ClpP protease subunit